MYSALKAEVVLPDDPATALNTGRTRTPRAPCRIS